MAASPRERRGCGSVILVSGLKYNTLCIPRLEIPPGRTAIIGRNGSGKTSLLRILAGLAQPEQGSINVPGEAGELRVGWVDEFPDRNFIFSRVRDEIASSCRFRYISCEKTGQMVEEIASKARISHLLDRNTGTLSGGEKAMVALSAALVTSPPVLVLDEYDSHLDLSCIDAAETLLAASGARYTVQCTQNMELAAKCDTVVLLGGGRVRCAGPPRGVFPSLKNTCFYPFSWRFHDAGCL
jgi:energy-coupling factor transport system ATP-binding protein